MILLYSTLAAAGGLVVGILLGRRRDPSLPRGSTTSPHPTASDRESIANSSASLVRATSHVQQLAALREAQQAKDAFLANISHEIRTPLNGIIGALDMLLALPQAPLARELSETARQSSEALLELVNSLLDFTKIESGRLELESVSFRLWDLLDDLAEALAIRAHEKGLDFVIRVDPQVPDALTGDPARLRQVLTNLLGNAIKFTDEGEVHLQVSLVGWSGTRALLRLEVRDTGVGIPAAWHERIFEPFSQGDASTTRRYGGTGLGLSICRQLTERMGGHLGFTSQPQQGSLFWAVIPFEATQERPPAPPRQGTALLLEPHAGHREALRVLLRREGFHPLTVPSLHVFLEQHPQPELGVVDVVRLHAADLAILRQSQQTGMRWLLLTATGYPGEAQRAATEGLGLHLPKPLRRRALREALMGGQETPAPPLFAPLQSGPNPIALPRVLVVEDHPTNRAVALRMLAMLGVDADAVEGGMEALEALHRENYGLVLMDVQMPGMDGMQTTQAIRAAGSGLRNPRVPIVALTAHALKRDRERCLEAGMDGYLAKPLRMADLAEALKHWLGTIRDQPLEPDPESPRGSDPDAFYRRLGGDPALFRSVLEEYLEATRQDLDTLRAAQAAGVPEEVRRMAHKIKGASANLGAQDLASEALALETEARDGHLERAAERIQTLETRLGDVRGTYEAWIATK